MTLECATWHENVKNDIWMWNMTLECETWHFNVKHDILMW
jgi:hypothetical protein